MTHKLKDIVQNSDDLFFIKVTKPDKHQRSTWRYQMIDPRWHDDGFDNFKFRTVHLRRDNTFFIAYKSDESFSYFVDEKKAMFRNSVPKYVNSLIYYSIYSNDISIRKNEPSFKITQGEMRSNKIFNFLDLCYYYRNYTAIGTGYTRNLRNLIVLDIDEDCTKPDNKQELNNILLKFASYDTLPDFCVFNQETRHVQLQWLIQNCEYKEIDWELVNGIISDLNRDPNRNKEVDYKKTEFTKISDAGFKYRKFTMAMCSISKKKNFGDKNYTFWKAKNPMSALSGDNDLQLLMPYYEDGEIKYLSQEQMNGLFSTREARQNYFNNAPDITMIYEKLDPLMKPLIEKVSDKKARNIEDAKDLSDVNKDEKKKKKITVIGESRNTFVLNCTPLVTWETAKSMGYKHPDNIKGLDKENALIFKKTVYKRVRELFNVENEKYNGIWPGTTNISGYSVNEFDKTFNSAFQHAVANFKNLSYSEDDRKKSQESRHFKKDMKLMIVDTIRNENAKMTRNELLKEVNRYFEKPLSLGSLKRYISESNSMSDEDRSQLYEEYNMELDERKRQMDEAIEMGKSQKMIHICKKRYEYLLIKS